MKRHKKFSFACDTLAFIALADRECFCGDVIDAWLTGQQKTHLCVACNIRAMPENEKPPFYGGFCYV